MLKLFNARRLLATLCVGFVLVCVAWAQNGVPRAEKLSEYVNQFTSCHAGAHLDNLAIYLQNNPSSTGYVAIYGPAGPDGKYGEQAVYATKHYLVDTRGVEESRVKVVYAGLSEKMDELLTEVWLVPDGAQVPRPSKYKPDLDFTGQFVELYTWDSPEEGEGWSNSGMVASVGLSDLMRRRPEARAYLVAYQTDESAPGAWRRATEQQVERLSGYGVPAERVKIIFGGYAKEEKVKVWILPSDAPPPAKQRRERRPERAAMIASLDEIGLRYDEDWGFKGLAGVLRADAQLTACLVVRPGPAKTADADPEQPVDPDEPADVDVVRLAEKWKAELKKQGVGEERVIVMVVPTRESQSGSELETWVVPPGAPLPDPSAVDEQVVEEEAPVKP